jgi:hypothetical protein
VRAEAQQATDTDQRQLAAAAGFQSDVYILSGGFGVFSTGLGKLKAQLEQKGVDASLVSYQSWRGVSRKIVRHRQQYGRKPVVIIGHSLGANNAILIADDLKKKGVQVDLIVSYASTAPMTVPSNVRNVYNFYFESGGWGYIFTAGSGFGGTLNNVDMSKRPGMTHFNVDDSPDLRDEVVRNVLRYVRPAKASAEQHKMRGG